MGLPHSALYRYHYMKKIITGALLIICCIFIIQCEIKEVAPFFDGLYLEYDVLKTYRTRAEIRLKSEGTRQRTNITYRFESLGNKYRVTKTEVSSILGKLSEDIFNVDYNGKAEELENYLEVWLPVTELNVGDAIYGTFKVDRKERWHEWDVSVLIDESAPYSEWYFHTETGYLVGMKSGAGLKVVATQERDQILVDTNSLDTNNAIR